MATDWGLQQISKLLPLDTDSLKQILDYSATLSQAEAAEHLKNLLGDSPQAFEFISSFNQRRKATQTVAEPEDDRVPRGQPRQKKKKPLLNNLPAPRKLQDHGNVQGGYQKRDEEDYMPSSSKSSKDVPGKFSLSSNPAARQMPILLDPALPNVHARTASPAKSQQASRNASPAHQSRGTSPSKKSKSTKVSIPGGTAMHGASTTMSDLESAIRALELTTNPSLPPADPKLRKCSCMGLQHPLLAAAPNCLSCGKIICAKEGLAPCTFCGAALLTGSQVQDMIDALRRERASERIAANNAAQAARTGKAPDNSALTKAQAHRDRLLEFQATNAQRTKVVDEAAAFETPHAGVSQWSSAEERAAQLRSQQKVLREMEWNARPEYEKRRMVVSLDIKGGKAVKQMQQISLHEAMGPEEDDIPEIHEIPVPQKSDGGAFSQNPLLGHLVKPVWKAADGVTSSEDDMQRQNSRKLWRRVQDDTTDNEEIILNGGIYGGRELERTFAEEPAYG